MTAKKRCKKATPAAQHGCIMSEMKRKEKSGALVVGEAFRHNRTQHANARMSDELQFDSSQFHARTRAFPACDDFYKNFRFFPGGKLHFFLAIYFPLRPQKPVAVNMDEQNSVPECTWHLIASAF
jgi:hypothetical protein